MYWYLEKPEDRPTAFLHKLNAELEAGLIPVDEKGRFKEEKHKQILLKMAEWEQAWGRYYYQPNKKMYWWFLMPHWIKGIRGGNQSGKTAGCVVDFVMQIEGWHPLQEKNMERLMEEAYDPKVRKWLKELYERKIFYPDPPVKMRCATLDYSLVEKVLGQEYEKWATKEWLDDIAYTNEKKRKITWRKDSPAKGSFIEFMTYEQSVLAHGGAARHGIHHDEECSEALWAQSRMRVSTTNGRLIIGMTAEQGVTWTNDSIWKKGLHGRDKKVFAVEMSTYDNPIVTQQMVDDIKLDCRTPEEIEIRIYGKSTPRGGYVYPMAKDTHPWVIDPFQIPEESGYLIMAIDPHPQLPHAVLWIWVDYGELKDGELKGYKHPLFMDKPNLYEVAELFQPCNIPTLADYIREKETYEIGRTNDFVLCDQFAWNRDQNNPKTIADQLQEAGIMVSPASKDRDSGIIKVQEMLSLQFGKDLPEDKEKALVINRQFPQIMTFDTLTHLRDERNKYRWKKPRQRFTEDIPVAQKPVDKDDHMMENEYRIALFVVDGQMQLIESDPYKEDFKAQLVSKGVPIDVNFDEPQLEEHFAQ